MIAEVILERALDKALDYAVPEALQGRAIPGAMVEVPLRGQLCRGFIMQVKAESPYSRLADISRIAEGEAHISLELLRLAQWIADYYVAPLHKVLKQMLPSAVRREVGKKQQLYVMRNITRNEMADRAAALRRSAPAQAVLLDHLLKVRKEILLTELLECTGCSSSSLQALEKAGLVKLARCDVERSPLDEAEYLLTPSKQLNSEQAHALRAINASLTSNEFAVHLLYGITGSGKTEVYLQAVEAALASGKGVLMLVPEIALTAQAVERFRARFPDKAAILHHRLSDGERHDQWHALRRGELMVAIGARSVVYAPVSNLGLIIIDEEHESSYKATEESPAIQARDVAIVRAKLCNASVILGSATPSLESRYNAQLGRYKMHRLTRRAEESQLPRFKIVDMRTQRDRGNFLFSQDLMKALELRLERGEQSILFLNRRGYFTIQKCLACGEATQCPHCSVSLTFHRHDQQLRCHCCGYMLTPAPQACKACGSQQTLRFSGVGTEQVEIQLRKLLGTVRTLRMDADTTRHKGSHERLIREFGQGRADVLIGTQMIAKGLHFPRVTLVGILNADASLQIPDFRGGEVTFQLLTQVAGRAGRGALAGEVIVQTSLPEHQIIHWAAAQDYDKFFEDELKSREALGYPPFSRLVRLVIVSESESKVQKAAAELADDLSRRAPPGVSIYPPVECGVARVKDRYRWQILMIQPRAGMLQGLLRGLARPYGVHIQIDVDPASTF